MKRKGNILLECPWKCSVDALNLGSDFRNRMDEVHISMGEELRLFSTRHSLIQMATNSPEIDW